MIQNMHLFHRTRSQKHASWKQYTDHSKIVTYISQESYNKKDS